MNVSHQTRPPFMLDVPIFTRENHPAFNSNMSFLDYQRYTVWDIAEWQAANRDRTEPTHRSLSDRLKYQYFSWLGGKKIAKKTNGKIKARELRRILVFRYDKIGDYICASPALRWLKAAAPHAHIDVVSSFVNRPIALNDLNVSQVFSIHPDRNYDPISWQSAIRAARQNQYDLIVSLVYTKATKGATLASLISKTAAKISIEHEKRSAIYGLVFDYQVPAVAFEEHWGRTMRRAVTETIEPTTPIPNDMPAYLSLKSHHFDSILQLARRNGLAFAVKSENVFIDGVADRSLPTLAGNPYCIVNVAASRFKPDCAWSLERINEACLLLLRQYPDLFVFVTGAPSEKNMVDDVVHAVSSSRCQALMMSLLEVCATVSGALFVLTPDTATVHIASAAGVPVVGLYATLRSVAEWYPYQSPFALLLSPNEGSINEIPMTHVHEALSALFETHRIPQLK